MSKLLWDQAGERFFETGVDHGVLFVRGEDGDYAEGVAWNGLTAVTESPEGAEVSAIYADNMKYLNLRSAENFKATIEAYTYPEEFEECDGSKSLKPGFKVGQQARKTFAFCYRTKVGNDLDPDATAYKLHIIYGATASPSERAYATVNESPEAITFSWEIDTIPVEITSVDGVKPTAHIELDSREIDPTVLEQIEASLFGTDGEGEEAGTDPTLLMPDEILALFTK